MPRPDATEPPQPEEPGRTITPARYDAIHRALLAGLLSNIGQKAEANEYNGARGKKFYLFPGSGLFTRKPPWVMAGELTETTRLYARTVAKIDPVWVERLADHLVDRQYTDPHWQRDTAHVYASERVSLYGLVVVPRRRVHYGPIDANASREIFIREALVHGEFNTDAPYFRNNRQLVRDIELLEAKLRRRDVLVDPQTRFGFYDLRIPPGIYNGPLFEKWRREAEAKDKKLLFMKKEELMLDTIEPPKDQFPDAVLAHELRVPLTYRYDLGDPEDGVTATLPLGALNYLDPEPFEWLVPGHLEEKIAGLIKLLPKEFRIPLVPVPETVKKLLPLLKFGDGSLPQQLSWHIGRISDVRVPAGTWEPDHVPDYLRMNFRIVDAAGKTLEMGRDLGEIRKKLRIEVKQTFDRLPPSEWHRDDVTRWDFGGLPPVVQIKRPGMTLKGYPALVEVGEKAHLRVLESAEASATACRAGIRRLFMIQLGGEIKHLAKRLPGMDRMAMHYGPVSPAEDLRRDVTDLVVDRAMYDGLPPDVPPVRTQEAFALLAEAGWKRLGPASREVADLLIPTLEQFQELSVQLSKPFPLLLHASVSDMKEQLANLVYKGFVVRSPWPWLKHYPRFLKGIEVRLKKLLNAGAMRDALAMQDVRPLWEQYLKRAQKHRTEGVSDPALRQFRWMLEELRISLFAQELKTSTPVSVKRLQGIWAEVK